METTPTFFVSDRLKGIPLVTSGRRREMEDKVVKSAPQVSRVNQVIGKRETDIQQTRSSDGLLFKPSAMTASTANFVRAKTTTTTRRPASQRARLNQKPTSSSARPKVQPTTVRAVSANSSLEPAKTTTMAPMVSTTTLKADLNQMQRSSNTPNLTRTSQTLTTQPGYQRRTPQTVLSRGFTNKLNDGAFAGENWVLFNRVDGSFSLFELLALMSSILIVSTVVLVIFLSWFKSLKRKRAPQQSTSKGANQPQQVIIDLASKSPTSQLDAISGRTSKLSMISGKVGNGKLPSNELPIKKSPDKIGEINDKVGESQKIMSEFKAGANVANKAMAIVQPTENNDKNSSAGSDKTIQTKDELNPKQRPINRSVSDLSGAQRQANSVLSDAQRVSALEDIFNGSTPNLNSKLDQISSEADKIGAELKRSLPDLSKASIKAQTSTSSLESIELPQTLVESIKSSDPKNPANAEAPSPNLLLGQQAAAPISSNTSEPVKESTKEKEPPLVENKTSEKADRGSTTPNKTRAAKKIEQANEKKEPIGSKSKMNERKQKESTRPANPMSKQIQNDPKKPEESKQTNANATKSKANPAKTEVKNHQIVVNKLDKRKTNLEIVDLRDESVTGKMRPENEGSSSDKEIGVGGAGSTSGDPAAWISMDGVAVVQPNPSASAPTSNANQSAQSPTLHPSQTLMSPSEIIESRFHVEYGSKTKKSKTNEEEQDGKHKDSFDSKAEEYILNNIENELEQDNKMKNRKYFVYVVHDGHFTAKKECIARIELPQKRRITLAEVRQLIANSRDISLSSLRRNRFKFVTETYRLLNENEDAAVLHQVYPTQGVFLKLNIPEQENQVYPFKGRPGRLSSGSGTTPSSLAQTTIASRRRANRGARMRADGSGALDTLPAIEVDYAQNSGGAFSYGRTRASSVGRRVASKPNSGAYYRSKSSVQTGRRANQQQNRATGRLPAIGRSTSIRAVPGGGGGSRNDRASPVEQSSKSLISGTASDLGNNVLSGVKQLFSATFKR